MQAHAKVPHISDEETVDFRDLPWYREAKAEMTPGLALRIHRESHGWSKAKLGELLGGVNRRDVSALEKGRRPVSLNIARRASEVFGIPLRSILEPNRIPEQNSDG